MSNNNLGTSYAGTHCPTYVAITAVSGAVSTFTATPVGTAAAIGYCIHGLAYTKATITTGATPTLDTNTAAAFLPLAASRACLVVLALDAAGAVKGFQSNIITLDAAGVFQGAIEFPFVSDAYAPFCYIKCVNGSTGSAWTFGASNWNATGMTPTATSVMMLPGRPVAS